MPDLIDTPPHLLAGRRFKVQGLPTRDGRLEIYEDPVPGLEYVIGNDGALGMEDRDFDAGVVLVKGDGPARQVAELHGHWGERYDRLLYAVHVHYNNAFMVMERQCGLAVLRRLYSEYDCDRLYYERKEIAANRRYMDSLGHPKVYRDLILRELRRAMMDGAILIRSRLLLDQMQRLEFHAPGEDVSTGIRKGDEALRVRLPGGGSPDLVMAAAYAWLGWNEIAHFPAPPKEWEPDTLGAILDHAQPGEEEDEGGGGRQDRVSLRSKRLRRRR